MIVSSDFFPEFDYYRAIKESMLDVFLGMVANGTIGIDIKAPAIEMIVSLGLPMG